MSICGNQQPHLEVTLASGTYTEVKPSMSFPGRPSVVVKSWPVLVLEFLNRGLDTEYVVHEQTMKAQIQVKKDQNNEKHLQWPVIYDIFDIFLIILAIAA